MAKLCRAARRRELAAKRTPVINNYIASHPIRKLQIGAGRNPLAGWLNSDLDPATDDIVSIDVRQPLPFSSQLFDYMFCEHLIEHVSYREGFCFLKESYRVLKPGGKIRLSTPNLRIIMELCSPSHTASQKRYIQWVAHRYFPDEPSANECFVINNFLYNFGHRFIYDPATLEALLQAVGFTQVHRCPVGQSEDENLRNIESHGKAIGEEMNSFESMIFEGRRPV